MQGIDQYDFGTEFEDLDILYDFILVDLLLKPLVVFLWAGEDLAEWWRYNLLSKSYGILKKYYNALIMPKSMLAAVWPNGKAFDYESKDSEFDPQLGHHYFLFLTTTPIFI